MMPSSPHMDKRWLPQPYAFEPSASCQRPRANHVRRSDDPPGYSVFRLSRRSMAFWSAMAVERSLDQYRICRSHPAMLFSDIVLGCMRCLWAGRDSHLYAGADLDCFGIAYGHFGGVGSLQIRALISARPRRREPLPTRLSRVEFFAS